MEEIDGYIKDLEKLKSNIKKSKCRSYEGIHVQNKIDWLKSIDEEVKKLSEKLEDNDFIELKARFCSLLKELTITIDSLQLKTKLNNYQK